VSQTVTSLATAAGGVLAGAALAGMWALRLRTLLTRTRTRVAALLTDIANAQPLLDQLCSERDEYHRQATHDETTDMPNRRAAIGHLTRAMQDGEQVGAVVLDLMRFKVVNDRLGHRVGNTLLAQVGERLRRLARADVFPARLSGDEFTLIVRGDSATTAAVAAAAWRDISQIPFVLDERHVDITASVGYATTADAGPDPELLLHRADIAMYWAKADGGGVSGYDDQMGDHPGDGRPRDWQQLQRR
jgi:diguanylate cyclase (GGDEF)-like protein